MSSPSPVPPLSPPSLTRFVGVTEATFQQARGRLESQLQRDADGCESAEEVNRLLPPDGCTLLHLAASNDYQGVAATLIAKGADLDIADPDGWTPLHAAVSWGHAHMAELLVRAGAALDAVTKNGEGVQDLAVGGSPALQAAVKRLPEFAAVGVPAAGAQANPESLPSVTVHDDDAAAARPPGLADAHVANTHDVDEEGRPESPCLGEERRRPSHSMLRSRSADVGLYRRRSSISRSHTDVRQRWRLPGGPMRACML